MPVTKQQVDVYTNGLSTLAFQNKVMHQTSNTEFYTKRNSSSTWIGYLTAPSGTQGTYDFISNCFPSIVVMQANAATHYYTLICDLSGNEMLYADGSIVKLYWDAVANKLKCGIPPL